MIRRWLIRSPFIALAVICVVVWVTSYWRAGDVGRYGLSAYRAGYNHGRVFLDRLSLHNDGKFFMDYGYYSPPSSSRVHLTVLDSEGDWQGVDRRARYAAFGFSVVHDAVKDVYDFWIVTIPLWFLSLLATLLLMLVWRKTRPKYTGTGFPVEPTAAKGHTA